MKKWYQVRWIMNGVNVDCPRRTRVAQMSEGVITLPAVVVQAVSSPPHRIPLDCLVLVPGKQLSCLWQKGREEMLTNAATLAGLSKLEGSSFRRDWTLSSCIAWELVYTQNSVDNSHNRFHSVHGIPSFWYILIAPLIFFRRVLNTNLSLSAKYNAEWHTRIEMHTSPSFSPPTYTVKFPDSQAEQVSPNETTYR